jgi:hypothetical protein
MRLSSIGSMNVYTTKDNLTIRIKSFGTWRITHPEIFTYKVDDINTLMRNLIIGVLCTQASINTLDEMMLKREDIEDQCLEVINMRAKDFGFMFQNIEFNEITLPNDILNAVSASALARRNAEAKLIEAQAEIDSAMMYKQAADQVSQNPISLQLQWLETMKDIAKSTVSTLVLPDTCIGSWKDIISKGDGSYPSRSSSDRKKSRKSQQNSENWEVDQAQKKKKKRGKKSKRTRKSGSGNDSDNERLS